MIQLIGIMVCVIGWMIGAYIITRMVSFLTRKGEGSESSIVKVITAITIVIAVVSLVIVTFSGYLLIAEDISTTWREYQHQESMADELDQALKDFIEAHRSLTDE